MEIAKTILQQLGGNKFTVMTGAKNYVAQQDGLSFRLPGNAKYKGKTVNYVKITLTPMDLYDVEFGYIRGMKYTVLNTVEGIYFDMLADTFERNTGLYTHL